MKNKPLLSNKDAATYLSVSPGSLKQSRVNGKLLGIKTPAFMKIGYNVRYKQETLDIWLGQFKETEA